jgi:hypothetical protein
LHYSTPTARRSNSLLLARGIGQFTIAHLIPDEGEQALHVSTTELPAGTGEGDCPGMAERGGMMMFQRAPEETGRRRQQIRSKLV